MDTHFSHKVFAEQMKLSFPLLSDFNREVIPNYVGYYPDVAGYKRVGRRGVYVIDRRGKIVYRWIGEERPGELPNVEEVLRATQGASDTGAG